LKKLAAFIFAIVLLIGIVIPAGTSHADEGPVFRLSSSASAISPNAEVTVRVSGSGLSDVNAYEVRLHVEPVVSGQSANLTLQSQRNLMPRNGFTAISQTEGVISFAFAMEGNQSTVNGEADLGSFTFKGTGVGQVRVTLESVKLLDHVLADTTHQVGRSVDIGIGGSSPPPPAPTPPPQTSPTPTPKPSGPASPTPKPSADSVVTVTATPDAAGVVSVTVPSEQLDQAIQKAQGGTAKIKVEISGIATAVSVDIPNEQLRSADQVKRIEVDMGLASVTFDPGLVKGYAESGSSSLRVSVSKADVSQLSDEVRQRIGDHAVYDFNLSMGGTAISQFGGGNPVTVSVPYTLQPGEHPSKIVVYFISDNGELEVVKNGKYDPSTGRISFKPKHFSSYAFVPAQATFTDLAGVPWAQDGIEALAVREIVGGVGEGRFEPDRNVTRAEFVQMLMGMLDRIDDQAISTFTDAKKGTWSYKPIASAEALGIVNGREDGSFGIFHEISRQEMAAMIDRAARQSGLTLTDVSTSQAAGAADSATAEQSLPFVDRLAIAPYALQAIASLHAAGMLEGMGDGRIAPNDPATRAQAAILLYRLYMNTQ
jgi:hypothetical protein